MNILQRVWRGGAVSFARGVHPPSRKGALGEQPIEPLPTPPLLLVPLHQHVGAPASLVVKPRDRVEVGDLIGEAVPDRVSARVHSPTAGVVQAVTAVTLPNGRSSLAVPIKSETTGGERFAAAEGVAYDALLAGNWPLAKEAGARLFPREIIERIRDAGIVGMGGAGFPTHLKLALSRRATIHVVLLNGCECEPYLASDHRLMVEAPDAITAGMMLAAKACGASRYVIAIEDDKPAAIAAMARSAATLKGARITVCRTKYPMGGERQLIPAVFGQVVPTDGFPLDIGILVLNVATAAAIAAAVLRDRKLTHRVLSVSGAGIREPKNLLVPLGTTFREIIQHCGGLTHDARRVIAGGPMMGFSVADLSAPVTKGTSGITVLTSRDIQEAGQTACIRCGRCLDVCPLRLSPTKMAHAARHGDYELAKAYDIGACCECGCCAYVCPARIPLVQHIRSGKAALLRT